ncbi:hypothetical protein E2I00_000725 [Balaenoptera physalus]|uniref:Uncharacterized protein n=1 Tax=Balaenoptera physalus TaxID=9770 RepID=A0A643BLB5_BALPH|nr:hypothetical protein E2I00_000725 [Balaenoptera physalus]
MISLALQIIHVGNSYQREKYKGSREGINSAAAQKLQQKTLDWTLNNFREENDSAEGWRPQGSLPYSRTFRERPEHRDLNVFKATIPTQDNSGPLLVLLQTLRLQTPGPQGVRSGGVSLRPCTASRSRRPAAVVRRPAYCAYNPHTRAAAPSYPAIHSELPVPDDPGMGNLGRFMTRESRRDSGGGCADSGYDDMRMTMIMRAAALIDVMMISTYLDC